MAESARKVVRATAPLFYVAGLVAVVVCVMSVLSFIEYNIGFADYEGDGGPNNFTTLYFNGDVPGAISLALIGGVVFGVLGRVLSWSDGLRRPTLADHAWHCALLYALVVLSGLVVVTEYAANYGAAASGVSGGYALVVAVFITAGYAIFLDALVLSRRAHQAGIDAGASA